MGGDDAPDFVIDGAEIVASSNQNVHFQFYGNSDIITPILQNCIALQGRYDLIHTDQFISPDEKPSIALRKGIKSSMRLAINSVHDKSSDAVISAGNTGALMAISKIVLKPLAEIDRPAIVTFIPNQKRKATVMLDMGANIECDSDVLYQFALMGYAFAKAVLKIENPTIGLLNVGSEDLKGSDAVRAAAAMIKDSELAGAFYGYVEGNDICKGTVDVVVTDGFCGNITLKAIEGTAKMISSALKEGLSSSFLAKVGYLLASVSLGKVFKQFDPRLYNGAMLIGLNGIVVKSHGSTDKIGFANAIRVAMSLVEDKINDKIIQEVRSSGFEGEVIEG
jgi:glycerol-3-phosphate acyltransferase PlsX